MALGVLVTLAGTIVTAALIAILLIRRVYRTLPVFVAYQIYSLLECIILLAATPQGLMSELYIRLWVVTISLDTIFYFCVLAEIGLSLLRHDKRASSELLTAAFLFVPFCLAAWFLANWKISPSNSFEVRIVVLVAQITGTAPAAGFLSLAVWSQLVKLRWPARELRIATGMGSWALVFFVALVLHSHGLNGPENSWIDLLTPVCCLVVLLYWLYCFWMEPGATAEKADNGRNPAASGRSGLRQSRFDGEPQSTQIGSLMRPILSLQQAARR